MIWLPIKSVDSSIKVPNSQIIFGIIYTDNNKKNTLKKRTEIQIKGKEKNNKNATVLQKYHKPSKT